jgi:hypothetical protein
VTQGSRQSLLPAPDFLLRSLCCLLFNFGVVVGQGLVTFQLVLDVGQDLLGVGAGGGGDQPSMILNTREQSPLLYSVFSVDSCSEKCAPGARCF